MAAIPARLSLAASAAIGLGAALLWLPVACAAQPRAPAGDDPMQVLADVVLIESECRQLAVDYGKLFAYAEGNGIPPVDILPTGDRRAAFDAAYRHRARELHGEQICADLAAARDATIPGVFTAR